MAALITWTGTRWRPFQPSDLDLPGVVYAAKVAGSGSLDPSIPIVTGRDSLDVVREQHRRFRLKIAAVP